MQAPLPQPHLLASKVTSGQRVRLSGESLIVEAKAGRDEWRTVYQLPLESIQAVYAYTSRDWAYLAIGAAYFVGLSVVLTIAGIAAQAGAATWISGFALLFLIVGAVTGYRVVMVPLPQVRVETLNQALIFPRKDEALLRQLVDGLPVVWEETPETPGEEQPAPPEPESSAPPPTPPPIAP